MSRRSVRSALAAMVAALGISVFALPTLAQAHARAHTAAVTVNVAASEFKFKLSKSTVKHGKVTFKVTNKGSIQHDFKINGKKTPLISPGKTATLVVTFTKPGKYRYLCTVLGHAEQGMQGTLKVT
jgi:uncharacterized cupredoxin-like copper-binding protein